MRSDGCEVDVEGGGGGCPTTSTGVTNLRANFLLVKWSTHDLMNVWGLPGVCISCIWMWTPPPPYIHLTSTWCHSCDRCFEAFPVFRTLPNWTTKTGEAWERGLRCGGEGGGQTSDWSTLFMTTIVWLMNDNDLPPQYLPWASVIRIYLARL